jgi:dual specificity MAP kinase phosphatase
MHGLVYPPNLLNSLPILDTDIHSLDSTTFAQLHLQHILSHPPDNILFPFLHGLEGDNHAQNAFFATSNSTHPVQHRHHHYHSQELSTHITPKIPKYRGLVWVVCEEDLEQAGDVVSLRILRRKPVVFPLEKSGSSSYSESEEEYEEFYDEDEDLEMMSMSMDLDDRSSFTADDDDVVLASPIFNSQMQVDDVAVVAPDSLDHTTSTDAPAELDLDNVMQQKEEPHMHSVHHRPAHPPTSVPLPIRLPNIITHILTPSTNSSTSPVSIFDSPVGTEMGSLSSGAPSDCPTQSSSSAQTPQSQSQPIQPQSSYTSDPYSPPLLTSTFRPKELLRRVRVERPDGDASASPQRKWEFVPAKVPDGISLRNFGIQVVSVFPVLEGCFSAFRGYSPPFSLSSFLSFLWFGSVAFILSISERGHTTSSLTPVHFR